MTERPKDLASRIERLEKENRRLKRVGAGLFAAAAAALLMSASATFCKTVWAERLVLRDSSGRDRLMMDAYSGGSPTVTMRDAKGKAVARLSWQDGLTMEMLDRDGECRSRTRVHQDGRVTTERDEELDAVGMIR